MNKLSISKRRLHDNLFVYSLVFYPLLLFFIFYVVVNFNSILLAFQTIDGTGRHWSKPILGNFKAFIDGISADGDRLRFSFFNSIKMYLINLAITTPFSFLFSYVLFKKCWGHKLITMLGLIPNMMSGLVISLVIVQLLGGNGVLAMFHEKFGWFQNGVPDLLYDERYAFTFTTLYPIWLSFAMSFVLLPTSMRGINSEIFESAQIDGVSNMFQEIFYIIFPLIYPTLCTFWITGFSSIFMSAGCLVEFYPDANNKPPDHVYNMGYYLMQEYLQGGGSEFSAPHYAAGGIILTCIMAPLTFLLKWALEKFGPSED